MKKIGLVGGLGPESTLDYYKGLIAAFAQEDGYDYPEIFIHSLNLGQALEMFANQAWDELAQMLISSVEALARAGADFAAIASNTPHLVFDQVQAASPLPLLSIVEATAQHAACRGLARLGLLGTQTTMRSDLFQGVFAPRGMAVVAPNQADQALIQQRLDQEIERGIFRDATRQELLGVVARLKDEQAIDGVILGCTELPLILTRDELGLPFLNTTAIHVAAIAAFCRGEA